MNTTLAPGFHVRPGRAVDTSAYDQFTGRWSRLFVPLVLGVADVQPGDRVLDVATGTGEAAVAIIPAIGASGHLIGADIAPAMLEAARGRLKEQTFLPVAVATRWGPGREFESGGRLRMSVEMLIGTGRA